MSGVGVMSDSSMWRVFGAAFAAIAMGCASPVRVEDIVVQNRTSRDANVVIALPGKAKFRFETTLPPGGEVRHGGWEAYAGQKVSVVAWGAWLWAPRTSTSLPAVGRERLRDQHGKAVPTLLILRDDEGSMRIERRVLLESGESTTP